MLKRLLCALAVWAAMSAAAPLHAAEIGAEKRAEIEKLLELSDAMAVTRQIATFTAQQLSAQARRTNRNLPPRTLEILTEEINGFLTENEPSLRDLYVAIYDRHFTVDDIRELNRFYATDVGRRVVKALPDIARESMVNGQRWAIALGPKMIDRVQQRLKKEGIDLENPINLN